MIKEAELYLLQRIPVKRGELLHSMCVSIIVVKTQNTRLDSVHVLHCFKHRDSTDHRCIILQSIFQFNCKSTNPVVSQELSSGIKMFSCGLHRHDTYCWRVLLVNCAYGAILLAIYLNTVIRYSTMLLAMIPQHTVYEIVQSASQPNLVNKVHYKTSQKQGTLKLREGKNTILKHKLPFRNTIETDGL